MSKVIKFENLHCETCGKLLPLNKCVAGEKYCSRKCAEESLYEKDEYEPRRSNR